MKKFLIVTVPFLHSRVRFYTVSYLAAIIRSAGWECDYLDLNRAAYDHGDDDIKAKWDTAQDDITETVLSFSRGVFSDALTAANVHDYAMVGLSLYLSCQEFSIPFLEALKDIGYRGVTLFGGPDCFPASHGAGYMGPGVCPDILLQGESEVILPEFLKQFETNGNYHTPLPGFLYKDDHGELVDTGVPTKPKSRDLDFIADSSVYGEGYSPLLSRSPAGAASTNALSATSGATSLP